MFSPYRRVLSLPGAASFSASGVVARLPMAMVGLGIVFMVSDRTGSYGVAGAVSASYVAANAVGGIPLARLIDRLGQRRVIGPAAALSVTSIVALMIIVETGGGFPWPHLAAAVAGVSMPNIGAAIRARWSNLVSDRPMLETAFALEAVNDEVVFITGPALAAGLAVAIHPAAGLFAAAVAAAAGTTWLISQHDTEPPVAPPSTEHARPMPWRRLIPLMISAVGLGASLGGTEVATVALADERGHPAAAGALIAVWSLGSLLAGLASGVMTFRRTPAARYRLGSIALALLLLPTPFVDDLAVMGLVLFLCGFAIAPTLIAAVSWVESMVPPDRLNEGIAAVITGLVAGVAPGAAVVGAVVDAHGASASYWVPVTVAFTGALIGFFAHSSSSQPSAAVEQNPA